MNKAKRPVRTPAVVPVGVIAAVALGLLGAAAVRDALQALDVVQGDSWSGWLAERLKLVEPADWMLPAGIAAVLIGLWFLVAALKPRRTTQWQVGDSAVWIRPQDAARLAAGAASELGSVLSATTSAGRRRITVKAVTTTDGAHVGEELTTAVTSRLAPLSRPPRIRTRVRLEEH
ncbi:DUF6286 domain-containing protein [Kribbella sp. CA-293567]|uniref:DUF6286 domain-containing protein n=1 Tax=Kribbella sp. CA-293567 TaxID=3002436 RepID=UPI0022DD7285|nr:DUF6286 domain-containing protein [Kribbella sp. CA-293567]WBQ04672.1 DUF6286 domain-containing protein [Kribbella sp. CA-293567]